jgi:SAM-dependent methyltransferase
MSETQHFPDILAPFVPTPHAVVDRMLKLAGVSADDLVYDLGCGDGRILIAAALKYGARGLGVDTEPHRVVESAANAKNAGVDHLLEFRLQDAQTVDFEPATVIMLYLVHWSTARFQPIIKSSARPGTRIVSHNYPMPDWLPTRIEKYNDAAAGTSGTLFLWTA